MNINLKVNKDFERCLTGLKDKYGEDFEILNGFHESQLNFSDFIDNFVDKPVADSTIDANANAHHKDICTLKGEKGKSEDKLFAFNKIFYELKKKYGLRTAKEWLEAEYSGKFYIHDAPSASLAPYCVLPQECCYFIYEGKIMHMSLEDIYTMVKVAEVYDSTAGVWYKKPKNLKVLDYDDATKKKRYTNVTLISKKKSDKNLFFVNARNGCSLITTADHKYITTEGEVEAADLTTGNTLYSADNSDQFTNSIYEYNGLKLTSELGWLVGMYLADGYETRGQLSICQDPVKSVDYYNHILEVLSNIGIDCVYYTQHTYFSRHAPEVIYSETNPPLRRRTIRLKQGAYKWESRIHTLFNGKYCNEKRLCPDYIHFNDDFLKGLLAGIIDGDGTVANNRMCMIRMTSRALINQIREIGLHFGVFFGNRYPYIQSQRARIKQKRPMYSAIINMAKHKDFFLSLPSIKIKKKFTVFTYNEKYSNNKYVYKFGKVGVRNMSKTYKPTNTVYDLSTESHTFVCNGVKIHNCFSYSLDRLAKEGLFFLKDYNNQAPKHLTTFLDDVIEFISFMCNRSSGAVGLPNVLVWTYYFWKKDVASGHYIKDPDYYLMQCFQKFIYRLNQPFLRVDQSAFVNMSIFDRPYYEALFGGVQFPDGTFAIDSMEEFIEHQKVFMEVVSEIRTQNLFTFPVLTYSLLYQNHKFVDEDFARWCSDHNCKWNDANFFQSDNVNTLSNCCFDGSQMTLTKTEKGEQYKTFKDLYTEQGDTPLGIFHKGSWAEGRVIRLPKRPMYKVITANQKVLLVTDNHLNCTLRGDVLTRRLTTDDYLLCSTAINTEEDSPQYREYRPHKGVLCFKVASIEPYETEDDFVYCFEMTNSNEPYFTLPNGIITHNCRLLSDTTKLSGHINSIGGSALSIGSVKVNTINLMRIAYESECDEETYLRILKQRAILCCKTLDVIRHIIARNVEKGLLPNYCEGGVDMSKQYLTVGLLGVFEVIEYFGYTSTDQFGYISYTDEGIQFAERIFAVLNNVKDNFTNEYSINIESVPGESCAIKLCQKDNLLYEQNDKFIYSNQWIPLSEKCTINEKIRLSAKLDVLCSGGAIAHINLEQNFPNTDAAWDMLNKIADAGVIYFAFNTKLNECENHHGFVGTDLCPECGKPTIDTWQRIVGFLQPVRHYSKDRKKEFSTRQWYQYAELRGEH